MSLDNALNAASQSVPECVAAGYVDMSTSMLLSIKTLDSHTSQSLDLISAATTDLFQGPNVTAIEQAFRQARGLPEDNMHHYFQEVVVYNDNLIHICLRGKTYPKHATVFVCRRHANLGMAITKARMALPKIEAAFPTK